MLTSGSAHHGSSICTCPLATFQGPIWNPKVRFSTSPQPKHPPTSISSLPASTIFSPQPRPFSIHLGPCSINLDKAPPPSSPQPPTLNHPSSSADQFKLVPPPPSHLWKRPGPTYQPRQGTPPLLSAPPASDAPLPPLLSLSLDEESTGFFFWVGEAPHRRQPARDKPPSQPALPSSLPQPPPHQIDRNRVEVILFGLNATSLPPPARPPPASINQTIDFQGFFFA
ncbi:hypothetical protein PGTUg99_000429 [Puccinia graminis f. sp. tritici]|uniref:Uncharacterized protein n=1 Tax=Puccinia graminis f. sp. tritici TaxID=56615 RepID=A0A5B0S7J9_PUCGR|nr:hypothetical protein PGTUg99_000429 [Puccinia graminis f. sp. tritici]